MQVAVVGHLGLLGRAVYKQMVERSSARDVICGIGRNDQVISNGAAIYDLVINCAGLSDRYRANKDPRWAWELETLVWHRLSSIRTKALVHVTSIIEKEEEISAYGKIKLHGEKFVTSAFKDNSSLVIVRPRYMIGQGLRKGVVFDLINHGFTFVTKDSTTALIATMAVAELCIREGLSGRRFRCYDIGGSNPMVTEDIAKACGVVKPRFGIVRNCHSPKGMCVMPGQKTSARYLAEFLKERESWIS